MTTSGRTVRSVLDLAVEEIELILERATELATGAEVRRSSGTLALLFLTPSLRTTAGLVAAGAQLGLVPLQLSSVRQDPNMSAGESLDDTLRTVAGYTRVLAYRGSSPCPDRVGGGAAVLNAGDGGTDCEHPSQALCDLFAIRWEFGDLRDARIGICGDLTMRATRSLLKQLDRTPPRQVVLIAPPARSGHGIHVGPELRGRLEQRDTADFSELDVLYLSGLPERRGSHAMASREREQFALNERSAPSLPSDAVVLSPLPVIDEISDELRRDPRVRLFGPSDRSLHVRAALLERLTEPTS